jgi:ribosome maturation factor RimP
MQLDEATKGRLASLAKRGAEELGYEFVGMEIVVEQGRPTLRIYIDSLGGINVKDCELVSRRISAILDEEDDGGPFAGRYFLEVSSPGVERPLFSVDDYRRFVNKKVRLKTRRPVEGRRSFVGLLVGVTDCDEILLSADEDDRATVIPFDLIDKAHLVYEEGIPKRKK